MSFAAFFEVTKINYIIMKRLKTLVLIVVLVATTISAYCIDEQSYGEMGLAIYQKRAKDLQAMLDAGADPNEMQALITPLGIAIEWGRDDCIDILLAHPDIDVHKMYTVIVRGGSGMMTNKNALLSAIGNENFEVAHKLLDMGINCDFVTKDCRLDGSFISDATPLIATYYCNKTKDAVALAQRIADNTKEIDRVFSYAEYEAEMIGLPDISLVQRLIGDDDYDRTIFNEVTISLIDRGADVKRFFEISQRGSDILAQYMTAEEYAAYTALQKYVSYSSCPLAAALRGNNEVLEYLLDKGAPMVRHDDGGAVLFCTCINIECLKVLLDRGVDINTCHPSGMPLLFLAITAENYDLIDGMLEMGADPFIESKGITVNDMMRSYPSSRKKKVQKIYKNHGYTL